MVGGDHSCLELVMFLRGLDWNERYINLFRPLLLNLLNVPNRHIHRYSCLFSQLKFLIRFIGWCLDQDLEFNFLVFVIYLFVIGPSDKCSAILYISGLVV